MAQSHRIPRDTTRYTVRRPMLIDAHMRAFIHRHAKHDTRDTASIRKDIMRYLLLRSLRLSLGDLRITGCTCGGLAKTPHSHRAPTRQSLVNRKHVTYSHDKLQITFILSPLTYVCATVHSRTSEVLCYSPVSPHCAQSSLVVPRPRLG